MSLTDTQIKDLSYRMDIPFGGCFFKDEIKKIEYNKGYFVNMQDCVDEKGQINPGTHWVYFQVQKTPNGQINPIYFDPYGQPAPEDVKKAVKKLSNRDNLPYTKKDVQSLMNNACGFYCLAFSHFINSSHHRNGNFYSDVDKFLDMFDDLNTSVDFKKNEYILLHFFRSKDPKLRKEIDVIKPIDSIQKESEKGGIDMLKIPMDIKYMDK